MHLSLFFIRILFLTTSFCYFSGAKSGAISVCFQEKYKIECEDRFFILIKEAYFGHFPKLDRRNKVLKSWCKKTDEYYNAQGLRDCYVNIIDKISGKCTGRQNCQMNVVNSEFISNNVSICKDIEYLTPKMSVYIKYNCFPLEYITDPLNVNVLHLSGGFISSVGYTQIKSQQINDYNVIKRYLEKHQLPITLPFQISNQTPKYIQFEVIENSMVFSNSELCEVGKSYERNFYEFIYKNDNGSTSNVKLCEAPYNDMGQIIGPISLKFLKIQFNVNFSAAYKNHQLFLLKYTMLRCPLVNMVNSTIKYNHIMNAALHPIVFVKVKCNEGMFFLRMSNSVKKKTEIQSNCIESTGAWDKNFQGEACVSKLPTTILPLISTTRKLIPTQSTNSSADTTIASGGQTQSYKNMTNFPPIIILRSTTTEAAAAARTAAATTTAADAVSNRKLLAILLPLILAIIVISLLCVYFRYWKRITCLQRMCDGFQKLYSNGRPNFGVVYSNGNSKCFPASTSRYTVVGDNPNTTDSIFLIPPSSGPTSPYSGSFNRLSSRTLTTKLGGSRGTGMLGSNDSVLLHPSSSFNGSLYYTPIAANSGNSSQILRHPHAFSCLYDERGNPVLVAPLQEELPSKARSKDSIMRKLFRPSSGSSRNSTLSGWPYTVKQNRERKTFLSDERFVGHLEGSQVGAGSQLILNSPGFIPPSMTASDITYRVDSNNNNNYLQRGEMPHAIHPYLYNQQRHSQQIPTTSDILSPTLDGYLEPQNRIPGIPSSGGNRSQKNSDYMVYDHNSSQQISRSSMNDDEEDNDMRERSKSINGLLSPYLEEKNGSQRELSLSFRRESSIIGDSNILDNNKSMDILQSPSDVDNVYPISVRPKNEVEPTGRDEKPTSLMSEEDLKRFSMISNQYYGLQLQGGAPAAVDEKDLLHGFPSNIQPEPQPLQQPKIHPNFAPRKASTIHRNTLNETGIQKNNITQSIPNISSNQRTQSNDSLYEVIDEEQLANVVDRKHMALPPTPREQ